MAEALRVRFLAIKESAGRQWRPVIMPTLVLWLLATIVSAGFLHPIDVTEYQRYAHAALRAPLLHRFPLEYPAPALVVFLLPLIVPLSYPWVFAVFAGIVLVVLVASYDGSGLADMDIEAARRLIVYMAVGATFLVTGRYDIFAVAAAFWSIRAARQDRWSAAWTWSCIGVVLKLFPAIFWPSFLIAEWRRNGRPPLRRLGRMAASIFVLAGIPALLNGSAALNALRYYLRRPTEIGSVPAGLSYLVDWHRSSLVKSFESINVVNESDPARLLDRGGPGRDRVPLDLAGPDPGAPPHGSRLPGRAHLFPAGCQGPFSPIPHVAHATLGALPDEARLAPGCPGQRGRLPI